MSTVLNGADYADRISQLVVARRRARFIRYARNGAIIALVAWSVEAIVVGDTDWSRINIEGMAKSAWRFIDFDASILLSLWEPALEIGRAHV